MTLDSDARAILRAGLRAVDPGRAVRRLVRPYRGGLRLGDRALVPDRGGAIRVVGLGKAAAAMGDEVADLLGARTRGLLAIPRGYPSPRSRLAVVWGDHPVPSSRSVAAGRALLREVRDARPEDRILFLISGGGSATAEVPVDPVGPGGLATTTRALLDCGAPIQEMNTIRRHLSQLKGGRLARASQAGGFATVAISDVVGDPPEDVASGPTVGDPTTFQDALRVVRRRGLRRRLPAAAVRYLEAGADRRHPETPKPSDPVFRSAVYRFAATNRTALEAAQRTAAGLGYDARIDRTPTVGETRPAGRRFATRLLRASPRRPSARLAGGETTVTLGRRPGRGGRNQEFALAAAAVIAGRGELLVLSAGTDGIDGPTDAAGGWVDASTWDRAQALGLDVPRALRRHAAYDALDALGGLLRTGPTGTNVMDLHVGLRRVSRDTAGSSRPRGDASSRRRRS